MRVRQQRLDFLQAVGHVGRRRVQALAVFKFHRHRRDLVLAHRGHAADLFDGVQLLLDGAADFGFDVRRRRARINRHHGDLRPLGIGEQIHRHAAIADEPHHRRQQHQRGDQVRFLEIAFDEVHGCLARFVRLHDLRAAGQRHQPRRSRHNHRFTRAHAAFDGHLVQRPVEHFNLDGPHRAVVHGKNPRALVALQQRVGWDNQALGGTQLHVHAHRRAGNKTRRRIGDIALEGRQMAVAHRGKHARHRGIHGRAVGLQRHRLAEVQPGKIFRRQRSADAHGLLAKPACNNGLPGTAKSPGSASRRATTPFARRDDPAVTQARPRLIRGVVSRLQVGRRRRPRRLANGPIAPARWP